LTLLRRAGTWMLPLWAPAQQRTAKYAALRPGHNR
jgi:hypothetical protein